MENDKKHQSKSFLSKKLLMSLSITFWATGVSLIETHVFLGLFLLLAFVCIAIFLYFNLFKINSLYRIRMPILSVVLIVIPCSLIINPIFISHSIFISQQSLIKIAEKIPEAATSDSGPIKLPKTYENTCPPGTAICMNGGRNNYIYGNHIIGSKSCIVINDSQDDTILGNKCE